MLYKHFRPIPALAPYIDCFWVIEASAESAVARQARMPADSRATLLLNFAGESRLLSEGDVIHHLNVGADLLGVHNQSYTLEHVGDTYLIAAQFLPGGLAPFVHCGVGELAAQFGYYDHSHMVKDFQAFAGTAPGRFVAATAGIVEVAYGSQNEFQDV